MKSHAPMFSGSSCSQTTSRDRRVVVEHGAQRHARERRQLLDAADRDLGRGLPLLAAGQIDVDLSAAEDDTTNRLRPAACLVIVDDRQEAALFELDRSGCDRWMPQQALRREDKERERIPVEQCRLTAQQVKVLRGRRAVHEAQVDARRRLQNPFGSGARVLRALPLVAVRQQEDERRLAAPTSRAPRSRTGRG